MINSIGRFIQDRRLAKNWTVEVLAEESGLSYGSIRAYEQGRRTPSVQSLNRLLVAFDIQDSTWVDYCTWVNPDDGTSHSLGLKGGFHPGKKLVSEDRYDSSQDIRLQVVELVLRADTETVQALFTLLKK